MRYVCSSQAYVRVVLGTLIESKKVLHEVTSGSCTITKSEILSSELLELRTHMVAERLRFIRLLRSSRFPSKHMWDKQ